MKAAGLVLLAAAGCDLGYGSFLNSVPVTDQHPGEVQVFLAIDGMSRAAFDQARARGEIARLVLAPLAKHLVQGQTVISSQIGHFLAESRPFRTLLFDHQAIDLGAEL
jgi:hypothetical protein